jgi:ribosomal protein S27E
MPDTVMKVECGNCGSDKFAIYYDPQAQGEHLECDVCGTVYFHA